MRTSFVFVSSLALSTGIIFAIYALIGYAESSFASALGSSFRKGLEISVALSVLYWVTNQAKKLRRKFGGKVEAISRKWKELEDAMSKQDSGKK